MPTTDRTGVTISVDVPKSGLPAYEPANFFHLSYSGPEVALLVGLIDIHAIAAAAGAKEKAPVKIRPEISHRFFMSARGLVLLKRVVDEMYEKLNESTDGALATESQNITQQA